MIEPKTRKEVRPHKLLLSSAMIQSTGMGLTLLIGILLARYLGPANYGIYGLVIAIVAVASVIAQFGLPSLAIREASATISSRPHASQRSVIVWFAAAGSLIGLLVASLMAVLFLWWPLGWLAGGIDLLAFASALTFLFAVLGIMIGLWRGLGHNLEGQAIDMVLRPALIVVGLFAFSRSNGGLSVEKALLVQAGVALLALGWVATSLTGYIRGPTGPDPYAPRQWKAAATSILLTTILLAINANYPLLVAGPFVSATDLGVLRVALACAALFGLPASIANISLGPVIARLYHDADRSPLADNIAHTTITTFVATAVGFLAVLLVGRPMIAILFGHEYLNAHAPLMIMGAAQLIVAAFGITGSYLNLTGRERLVVKAFIISVPTGLLISIPLAAVHGIAGAAFGNVVMVTLWHAYTFGLHGRSIDAPLSITAAWRHLRSGRRNFDLGIEP